MHVAGGFVELSGHVVSERPKKKKLSGGASVTMARWYYEAIGDNIEKKYEARKKIGVHSVKQGGKKNNRKSSQ